MTQQPQLTKEQIDWEFFSACHSVREEHFTDYDTVVEKTLKPALIQTGVDLKNCTIHGESIIFSAITSYSPVVLRFLVENGAPLNVTNNEGESPLEFAKRFLRETQPKPTKPFLLTYAFVNVDYLKELEDSQQNALAEYDGHEFKSLCYSMRERLIDELTDEQRAELTAVKERTNVNVPTLKEGDSHFIFFAVHIHAPAIVDYLLDNGAPTDTLSLNGKTLLEFAEATLNDTIINCSEDSPMIALAKETLEVIKKHQYQ